MIRWGTPNFVSLEAAVKYYATYGEDREDVEYKIENKIIFIGKPELRKGDTLVIDEDGRYHLEEDSSHG